MSGSVRLTITKVGGGSIKIKKKNKKMSCNGCRVLRKGCSEDCMLRHCLLRIENPQAQARATLFVAKFFGRAILMSFLSSVQANQRSGIHAYICVMSVFHSCMEKNISKPYIIKWRYMHEFSSFN